MSAWADALRWANVVLAGASLAVLIVTLMRRWGAITARDRRIGTSCALVLFVIAYGSGEAASQEVPLGLRVVLMFLALSCLAASLLWHFEEGL